MDTKLPAFLGPLSLNSFVDKHLRAMITNPITSECRLLSWRLNSRTVHPTGCCAALDPHEGGALSPPQKVNRHKVDGGQAHRTSRRFLILAPRVQIRLESLGRRPAGDPGENTPEAGRGGQYRDQCLRTIGSRTGNRTVRVPSNSQASVAVVRGPGDGLSKVRSPVVPITPPNYAPFPTSFVGLARDRTHNRARRRMQRSFGNVRVSSCRSKLHKTDRS